MGDARGRRSALLVRGERIGWTFRDRRQFRRPFPEPEPVATGVPAGARSSADVAKTTSLALIIVVIILCLIAESCVGLVGLSYFQSDAETAPGEPSIAEMRAFTVALAIGIGAVAAVLIAGLLTWRRLAVTRVGRVSRHHQRAFAESHAVWRERLAEYERAEQERIDSIVEWTPAAVTAGARRIDVFGGNLWSWEAFLTVFGTSTLASAGGLLVLDLSGEGVGAELASLAAEHGVAVDAQVLPSGLAESNLLDGLGVDELAGALVESVHGGAQPADRSTRTIDRRVLEQVLDVLGDNRSMARIAAALRAAMNEPGPTPELTAQERLQITDELFSDTYRAQIHENLRRLEAHTHPLRALGSRRRAPTPAQLTYLAVTDKDGARAELLEDLVVQSLTHRIVASPGSARTVVVAGADDLRRGHVERIADVCERRSVRLVVMFRHLRDASLDLIGGGSVVFMKLGNHEEANRAAGFIGRQHKFVLTSLTRTLGGSDTHTTGVNEGGSSGTQGPADFLATLTGGRFGTVTGYSHSRSWGSSESYAAASNWSDAEARQRVYEYTVEPRTLQDLPDYGLLFVESSPRGPVVRAVECNPDIVMLPRVSMEPLPGPQPASPSWQQQDWRQAPEPHR